MTLQGPVREGGLRHGVFGNGSEIIYNPDSDTEFLIIRWNENVDDERKSRFQIK
ncbi:hypothetical protein [Natronorubrum bangense]|uniref:hypothetical protein n=1 Tax=Natronorubrum bangense TaxID=61858 RepID=UPI001375E4CE|nr:hypothetical protein [Natronorubrum bangense]